MKKALWSTIVVTVWILSGCGGDGGGTADTFEQVSQQMFSTNNNLYKSISDYAEKYNGLMAYDPNGKKSDEMITKVDEMVVASQKMLDDLETYQSLLSKYHTKTSGSAKMSTKLGQSVDPLLILDIKDLIKQGLKEKEILEKMKKEGYSDVDIAEAMKNKTIKNLKNVVNYGASAVFGGGAAAFAGLAIGAAGAPVLVVVGGATAIGMAAGAFFSWCTSGSSQYYGALSTSAPVCSMASVKTETTKLPNGKVGFSFVLPKGKGSLCLHLDGKAPVCLNTSVNGDGNTISLDCLAAQNDPNAAATCNQKANLEGNISLEGSECAIDVTTVSATPTSVSTSSGANLVIKTVLPTAGCRAKYNLIGTDGYKQGSTLITDGKGQAHFHVPPGAEGVHDSVTVQILESHVSTHAGYTF